MRRVGLLRFEGAYFGDGKPTASADAPIWAPHAVLGDRESAPSLWAALEGIDGARLRRIVAR